MKPIHTKYRTIGLLGGSFNPAHRGHLHISLHALHKLKLDEVWWLVSPKNPLKKVSDLAAYGQRLQSARDVAKHPKIRVTDMEIRTHTHYTIDTVRWLMRRNPGTRFVWLMGADNLAQFHRWRKWKQLLKLLPVVIFDRAPYSHHAQRGKTYLSQRRFLLKNNEIGRFGKVPAMAFVHLRLAPESSTALRKHLENARI